MTMKESALGIAQTMTPSQPVNTQSAQQQHFSDHQSSMSNRSPRQQSPITPPTSRSSHRRLSGDEPRRSSPGAPLESMVISRYDHVHHPNHTYSNPASPAPSEPIQPVKESPTNIRAFADNDAKALFDRISTRTPCIFLCVGPPDDCRIIQVPFSEDYHDADIFREMKRAWSNTRTSLPFRRVTKVEEVTFRFSGDIECKQTLIDALKEKLIDIIIEMKGWNDKDAHRPERKRLIFGTYKSADPTHLCRTLHDKADAYKKASKAWQDSVRSDGASICLEDVLRGEWKHATQCPSLSVPFGRCNIKEYADVKHSLRSLELLPKITQAYQTPRLARGQRLLDGLTGNGTGVYTSRNLLRGIHHHNPRVGDLTFTGYKVTEEWQKLEIAISLLSSMTIAVGSFFLFRLMLQDWWLAIAASSSVFAVIILAIQWMMRVAESI